MNGILLDNWTLERIVQCMNNKEEDFSPEVIALIEILVLWDNIYYFDNGYSTYWQEHSVIEDFDIKEIIKPISIDDNANLSKQAEIEYYENFFKKYSSVVAKGALEYMNIASNIGLNYMPFDSRADFVRENNLFLEFKQYYDRYDAIHAIDKGVMEYYEKLNASIRKADMSFNPNILFSAIKRKSSSFAQMINIAKEWSEEASIKAFKNWCSQLEDDISNFKNLKIQRYENELKQIEKDIINKERNSNCSVSIGLPCSIGLSVNLPFVSGDAHLLFPMSLYLDAISDNAVLTNENCQ